MSENEDKVFLAKLKGSNLLKESEVEVVVKAYHQLKNAGESVHLSDVFLNKGILSNQQIKLIKNAIKEPKVRFLSDYELKQKLGAGGMGAVYLAEHKNTKKLFAIKVMSKVNSNSSKAIARFDREYRALTSLKHKNIIGGIEKGFANGYHFYVMDYFEGMSLKEVAKDLDKFDYAFIIKTILEIAKGLKYAQSKGFIHRDIKPDNIFITKPKNDIKIIDFGLVKNENEDSFGLTQSQSAMGTPHFISCEQAKDAKRADLRSDIYSLGATFYYLITKEFPVKGNTAFEILTALITEDITPPVKIEEKIPEAINAVVLHMMEKDPADRYQNYDHLIEDLQLILKGKPVTREFSSTIMLKHKAKPIWMNKKIVWVLAVIALCLISTVIMTLSSKTTQANIPDEPDKTQPGNENFIDTKIGNVTEKKITNKIVPVKPIIKEVFRSYSIPEFFNRGKQRKSKTSNQAIAINKIVDIYMSWLTVQPIDESAPKAEVLMTRSMLLMAMHGSGELYTGDNQVVMELHLVKILDAQDVNGSWKGSKGLDVVCTNAILEAFALKNSLGKIEKLEAACNKALINLKKYSQHLVIEDFNDCPIGLNGLFLDLSTARFANFLNPKYRLNRNLKNDMSMVKKIVQSNIKEIDNIFRIDNNITVQLLLGSRDGKDNRGNFQRQRNEKIIEYFNNNKSATAKESYLSFLALALSKDKKLNESIFKFGQAYYLKQNKILLPPRENEFKQYGSINGKVITNALAVLALQNLYKSFANIRILSRKDFRNNNQNNNNGTGRKRRRRSRKN